MFMNLFVFDLDGTLCDCWYNENSIGLYKDEADMVTRSINQDTYQYARPFEAAQHLINTIRENGHIVKVLTRTVAGHEYMNKLNFLKRYYGIDQSDVIGVVAEHEKLMYFDSVLSGCEYSKLYYFDDSIAFLMELRNHCILKYDDYVTHDIKLFHSSSIINRSVAEIANSGNIIDEYM